MRVTLISVNDDVSANGIRSISSYLKENGHSIRLILMPYRLSYRYPTAVMDELIEIAKDSSLIGISSTTYTSGRAIQVIDHLRTLKIRIVWGGIYATTCPEECIKHVDFVCRGEGETAMLELVETLERGEQNNNIGNFWIKQAGTIIKNDVRPYVENLDILPFADYDFSDQHILDHEKIVGMHERFLEGRLLIHTSRGCPYSCTYCCNRYIQNLYLRKGKQLRYRSIKKVIDELTQIKNKNRSLRFISITDDDFFARSLQELTTFCKEYKSKINLPFYCYVNPNTLSEEKLKLLIDAGLRKVEMGIQSGSEYINFRIYKRFTSNRAILKTARILNKYKSQMEPPDYQFIITNPYEKEQDILQTIDLVLKLPQPYILQTFNIVFFPGMELYEISKKNNVIKTSGDACFDLEYQNFFEHLRRKDVNLYLNLLLFWMQGPVTRTLIGIIPRPIVRSLMSRRVVNFANRVRYAILLASFLERFKRVIRFIAWKKILR